jgi:hypothetical protein
LLLQYAGQELSAYSASRLLRSLHPASSQNLERVWERAIGYDLRQDSPTQSTTGQPKTSQQHAISPTQEIAPLGKFPEASPHSERITHRMHPTSLLSPKRSLSASPSSSELLSRVPQSKSLETTASFHTAAVTETHLACLLMVMAVFPDISRGHVLSGIRARFDCSLGVEDLSDIVISKLLESSSYPQSEHGYLVDEEVSVPPGEGLATLHSPPPLQTQSRTTCPGWSAASSSSDDGSRAIGNESHSQPPRGSPGDRQASVPHLSQYVHSSSLRAKFRSPHRPPFAASTALLERTITSPSQDPWREVSTAQTGLAPLSLESSAASDDDSSMPSAGGSGATSPASPVSPAQLPKSELCGPRRTPFNRAGHLLDDPFTGSSSRVQSTGFYHKLREAASSASRIRVVSTPQSQ